MIGTTLTKCKPEESISDFPYRSLIGSLMFLASRTRPDILYAVTYLSQFNVMHSAKHVKCLKQVLQYVINTEHLVVNLSKCINESLYVHVDASWATDLDSCKFWRSYCVPWRSTSFLGVAKSKEALPEALWRLNASWATDLDSCKSFGGHIVYLGGAPLSWGCKKQGSVAGSTMEAEYIALVHAVREIYWMSSMFEYYILLNYVNVPKVFSDSMSSIQFMQNDLENTKTKHLRIKYCMHVIGLQKNIYSRKIHTIHNTADILQNGLL
uniref:Uncharacterized protein n=1 Tax=Strigamia maritima TaxID=126957 RepID=T1J6U1_STRMM